MSDRQWRLTNEEQHQYLASLQALDSIGAEQKTGNEQKNLTSTTIDEHVRDTPIHIDARGYSREIASQLDDKSYLGNRTIIVRPEQLDVLIHDDERRIVLGGTQYGSDPTHDLLVREHLEKTKDIVLTLVKKAGNCVVSTRITGKVLDDNTMSILGFKNDDDETQTIRITTETAQRDVEIAKNNIRTIEDLEHNIDILFHKKKIQSLQQSSERAHTLFGNLATANFSLYETVREFDRIMVLKNKRCDAYVIAPNTAIVFGKQLYGLPSTIVSGNDHERVIDLLFKTGHITYDMEKGRSRINQIEENIMIQFGHHLLESITQHMVPQERRKEAQELIDCKLTGFKRYKRFSAYTGTWFYNHEFKKLLHDGWEKLRDVLHSGASPATLPLHLRVNLLYSTSPCDHHTRAILARITPDDYPERFMYDHEGFLESYEKAEPAKKQAMIGRVQRFNEETPIAQIQEWLGMVSS